mgnify:CR=1 FL=1
MGQRPAAVFNIVDQLDERIDRLGGNAASRPSATIIPICGSTSVLRRRTARSRQMPE